MKEYLKKIPEELKGLINSARDIADRQNLKGYLVGGFVRDLILGVKNLDLDIVIEGDAIRFAGFFADRLGAKVTAHKQFGTATVLINSSLKVDFSSARKEFYPKPAHLPVVSPGSLREDLFRRDFTINAMAISLADSGLVDYFGGLVDLRNKKIRILHPLSFIDDPTRILRAIRFEQRYNFKIEPHTLKLLKDAVNLGLLQQVHPHRMRDDLILVLKEENPTKEIRRLSGLTGFDFISPKLTVSKNTYLLLAALTKEIRWFNKSDFERRPLDTWLIYLMGLFDPLDPKAAASVCLKFGLRKGEEKRILSAKQIKLKSIKELSRTGIKPSRISDLLKPLSYEALLVLRAKHNNPVFRRNIADFLEIYNGIRISVCGEDLHCLGVLPGPKYQKIFACVLTAKLNGEVKTKDEELALIKELLEKRS